MFEINNNAPNWKIFTWILSSVCNYSCSYCPDELHDGKYKNPDLQTAINIFNKFRDNRPIYIELVGGEPTLWPKLGNFIDSIADKNTFIELNTNGSRTKRYWDKFNSKVDFFYISFHPESANEEKFTETLESLHNRYRVQVTFLIHPLYWDKIKRYYDYLYFERTDLNINITPSLIRPKFGQNVIDGMTDEIRSLWNHKRINRAKPMSNDFPHMLSVNDRFVNWRKFQVNGFNSFKNFKCFAPTNRLWISANGDMYHASCKVGNSIGNIYTGKYNNTDGHLICPQNTCGCKFDAIIKKQHEVGFEVSEDVFDDTFKIK